MGRKNKSKASSTIPARETSKTSKQAPLLLELTDQLLKKCSTEPPIGPKLFEEYKELYSIIQCVIDLEKDICLPTTNREEHFDTFMQWLRESGLNLDDISIAQMHEGEWGLKAEREIKEDQLWLSVPSTVIMSTHTSKSSDLVSFLKNDPISKQLPNVALSLYLLEERWNPSSYWKAYLNILPPEYNTILYFNPEEMELLKGSPCLEEALKQYRHIVRQYAYYWKFFRRNRDSQALRLRNKFTFTGYRWAVSTVMTRQNALPSPDGSDRWISLVPLWDMCNHAQGEYSTNYNLQTRALECQAQRDYQKGDEIVIFYGPRTNAEFFIHNAFVDPDNQFDSVTIKLGISKNDPLASKKGLVLQQLKINPNDPFYVTNKPKEPISSRVLAFIRVFVMDENDLNGCLDSPKTSLVDADCQLEEALKDRAWRFLKARLALLLAAYPTSVQIDESILAAGIFPSNRAKMSLLLRLCEKRILHQALEFVNTQCH